MGLNSRTSLEEEILNEQVSIHRDNEDGQRGDFKFKVSWIVSDKSGGEGLGTPDLPPFPLHIKSVGKFTICLEQKFLQRRDCIFTAQLEVLRM